MRKDHTAPDRSIFVHPCAFRLLAFALCGAFLGALGAGILWKCGAVSGDLSFLRQKDMLLRRIVTASFFPILLLLADLSQRKAAFYFVFFCRGAAAAFVLCVGVNCFSQPDTWTLILALVFQCLLPLPALFCSAVRLAQSASFPKGRSRAFLILLPFAAEFVFLLAERLLPL